MKQLEPMKRLSILNDILGPVIRGPSSSHTGGSFFIARLARDLLGEAPVRARIVFDEQGSYGRVYRQQKCDLGFAAGLLGWEITDSRFSEALHFAARSGLKIAFELTSLPEADHPNFTLLELQGASGREIKLKAKSVGGGLVEIIELQGWPVLIRGDRYDYLFLIPEKEEEALKSFLNSFLPQAEKFDFQERGEEVLAHIVSCVSFNPALLETIKNKFTLKGFWSSQPLRLLASGEPLFRSATEALILAEKEKKSLGELAIAYESQILGLKESEIRKELGHRLEIMKQAVAYGLKKDLPLQLLRPAAHLILQAEKEGKLACGGPLTRAAARAMAAQHTAASMGVVCAAPTAGSAGTLPGVMVTLLEDRGVSEGKTIEALAAAGAVGLIVGYRATFAAEIAGCQVEIGAAGAMGAAAVVEAAGGEARQAFDAAAISFQNTMGSVCDLVQGICEIPCHTRNALAAASSFLCADLILGGYENPIPFDETIDAVYEVGKMLPQELKVTSLGGLALCPSAQSLKRREE